MPESKNPVTLRTRAFRGRRTGYIERLEDCVLDVFFDHPDLAWVKKHVGTIGEVQRHKRITERRREREDMMRDLGGRVRGGAS